MAQPLLACLLLQNTWVVDDTPGPGVDFTDIPPAIAAAADGDILLVQPGTYSNFALSGKGLRILGSGSQDTVVSLLGTTASSTIASVPAGSFVYVDRLRFEGSSPSIPLPVFPPPRLEILGPSTKVALADVVVLGGLAETALRADGAEVWAFRCALTGADGPQPSVAGGHALHARNGAAVHLSGSALQGGRGGWWGQFCLSIIPFVANAGHGAWIESGSQVWIADSPTLGGDQACCTEGILEICGSAGTGIRADAATVRVSGDSGSLVRGGDGGTYVGLGGPFTVPGPGIHSLGGSSVTVHSVPVLPGTCAMSPCFPAAPTVGTGIALNAPELPVLGVSGTLTLSGSATLSLANGPPNAAFAIAAAGAPARVPGGAFFLGEILIDPANWFVLAAGALSPAGAFSSTIPLAGISPVFLHFPVYLQGAVFDPGGFWRLSNSTVATLRP